MILTMLQRCLRNLRTSIPLIMVMAGLFHNSPASGKTSKDSLHFYLPFTSDAFPTLKSDLGDLFVSNGLTSIEVKTVDFWHPYERGLRLGHRGVYLAEPHYAAWAIHQHRFQPLLKLHGELKYVLAVRRDHTHWFELRDLSGATICNKPGLNLGAVWLNKILGQHRVSALKKELSDTNFVTKASDQFKTCDAFIMSSFDYKRINRETENRFTLLAQSPKFEHVAVVAHPEILNSDLVKVVKVLKSKAGRELLLPYFQTLGRWQNLMPVTVDDYKAVDAALLAPYWSEKTNP